MEHDPNTHQHGINGEWHQIWRTKTSPRIKNFLWRVTRGCLPTRLRLQARGVNCPSHCPFCDEDKTIKMCCLCAPRAYNASSE